VICHELKLRRLIRERIRQETSKKFSWNEFIDIIDNVSYNNFDKVISYLENCLNELGISSRAAYVLTSHSVLKVACNARGLRQNMFEVKIYERLKNLPVTKILKHENSEMPKWLVCELVNPIQSVKQFVPTMGHEHRR